MTNYILSIINKDKSYKEIKWLGQNNHMLIDIDNLTIMFEDELELKEDLIKRGILELKEHDRPLCITYKYKGEVKKLMYGLAYSKDKTFLSEGRIFYYLKAHSNDLVLLERLCNHYRNSYVQGTNVSAIRNYINSVRGNIETELDIENILKDLVIREICTYDTVNNKYKKDSKGNYIIKYRQIHELGMFLSNYDKTITKDKLKEVPNIKEMPINNEQIKPKVRVKNKNNNVPGQMSLFD